MLKIISYALCVLSLIFLASCSKAESKKDNREIHDLANRFILAWNQHDPKALADNWTEDGDLLTPWAKVVSGREEIEKHFASEHADMMKDAKVGFTIKNVRMIDPETAFIDADFVIIGMKVAGEKADPLRNHGVYLLVKRNGKWKFLIARPY